MAEKSIITIGAGLAGLSAGCYAQMNGYKTQIFEMHDLPGGLCPSWKRRCGSMQVRQGLDAGLCIPLQGSPGRYRTSVADQSLQRTPTAGAGELKCWANIAWPGREKHSESNRPERVWRTGGPRTQGS
jgi:monoamine oxidase